jgi:RNA polymerase sigma-70 factor (ECF subfamily)
MAGPGLQQEIAALYDAHAPMLFGWFSARTLSRETATDLLAETFAVAIEQYERFDPQRGEAGSWLWGIGRNLFRQYLRTAEVERRARERLAMHTPAVDDELERVDDRLDAARRIEALGDDLGGLSDGVAKAVRLRVIENLSYDDVAARCGCSVGAARVRVSRGLALLLDELAAVGQEGPA